VLAPPLLPIPNPTPPSLSARLRRRRDAAPSPGLDLSRTRPALPPAVALPLRLLRYLAGDPARVAFLLSVNPRRCFSCSPPMFLPRKIEFLGRGSAHFLRKFVAWEPIESGRFFFPFPRVVVSVGSSGELQWPCWHAVQCWGSGSFWGSHFEIRAWVLLSEISHFELLLL